MPRNEPVDPAAADSAFTAAPTAASEDVREDDAALPAAESLALIESQQARARSQFEGDPFWVYTAWGATWLLGFGSIAAALWSDPPLLPGFLPPWIGFTVLGMLIAVSIIVTMVIYIRPERGLRRSSQPGHRFALMWFLPFVLLAPAGAAVGELGLALEEEALINVTLTSLIVTVLYLVTGTLTSDDIQFRIGVALAATTFAALLAATALDDATAFLAAEAVLGGASFFTGAVAARRTAPGRR